MNKNLFRTFIVLSCLLTAVMLAGGYWIFSSNRSELEETSSTSVRLVSRTLSSALDDGYYPGSEDFEKLVQSFFRQYGGLLSLTVYSPEKGVFYYRSLKSGLPSAESLNQYSWSGKPVYTGYPGILITKSAPLSYSMNGTRFAVDTVFSGGLTVLNYKKALTLFFVFSAFFIMTIFMLFSIRGETPSAKSLTGTVPAEPQSSEPGTAVPEPAYAAPPAADPAPRTAVPVPAAPPAQNSVQTAFQEPPAGEKKINCIYSDRTGMVVRELLEDKLNQELKRSASFDQDLVLVIFSLRGLDTPDARKRFQSMVYETFPYRDLVFEYNDEAFALIMPNIDLDSCVAPVESFQLKLENASFTFNQKFSAGISARSGRGLGELAAAVASAATV